MTAIRRLATAAVLLAAATAAHAQLLGRDLDGNASTFEAYYDPALNITWLSDWNYGAGSIYDDGFSTTDGHMTWSNAVAWASNLNYFGFTGWRLPTVSPVNPVGFNLFFSADGRTDVGYALPGIGWGTASEMGHMYYVTLNNPTFGPRTNTGPFSNMQGDGYWSRSGVMNPNNDIWRFDTFVGYQSNYYPGGDLFAVAVRPGDVAPIPEPATVAMMLAGFGVLGMARRRRRP